MTRPRTLAPLCLVRVTADDAATIRHIAALEGVTVAQIVRQGVRLRIEQYQRTREAIRAAVTSGRKIERAAKAQGR